MLGLRFGIGTAHKGPKIFDGLGSWLVLTSQCGSLQQRGLMFSAPTMEVAPDISVRTVKPAMAIANQRKVCRRENAGRNSPIAFHQSIYSDMGMPRCW